MELRLKGYGTIEITNATLVDGGDILIEAADNFEKLAETTDYEITDVYLAKGNSSWWLIALLDVPEYLLEEKYESYIIENQADIHKLKALL